MDDPARVTAVDSRSRRHLEKSPYLGRGLIDLTKFGVLMQFDPLDHFDR